MDSFNEMKRRIFNYSPCKIHFVDKISNIRRGQESKDLYIDYNKMEAFCGDSMIKLENCKEALILCAIAYNRKNYWSKF